MADREKVIKGLECCRRGFCFACPYNDGIDENTDCKQRWADDALTLLKAQEQMVGLVEGYRPIVSKGETKKYYQCEICFQQIDVGDNYCRHCGRKVKWDD